MSEVKPDNNAALSFLRKWKPGGPWTLSAIATDKKQMRTQTLTTEDDLKAFLGEHNGLRNIYFNVNPLLSNQNKKAKREDIESMEWLHVDIDPRAGEDIDAERVRCLGLFTDKLPAGVPAPTVIIFSGGGYQGFWKLREPLLIDGDLAKAEDAKRYNQQLERLFGGDNCHNLDRIMRLPGTINIPDARKLKKGRTRVLATLVTFDDERVYDLAQFTPAAAVQMPNVPGGGGGVKPNIEISGNVARLADISELDQYGVPDRVKVICVQGRHPDEVKDGDNSRSAWVFDAVCNLVRSKVPDEVIFSILTDPEFGISESVLETGSNAQRYALRQIANAHEEVVEPWLRKMNERYKVIGNLGGKCKVIEELYDPILKRNRVTRLSFPDIHNFYCNKFVKIGTDANGLPRFAEVGKWWTKHPDRAEATTMVFAPNQDVPGAYNLWKGFAVDARPGDCSLFLDHVRLNVCGDDPEVYKYLCGWMATMIKYPASQGHVAVVLRGGKGVGKSFFAKQLGSLLGAHFLQISNPSHLVGNFNSHLRDVVLLFADEAFYAGDKKHASILKTLITEETIQIEAKGVDVESAPNFVHLIMASNDDHVVPASGDERRFLVLDVGAANQQQSDYFAAIAKQMDSGGREALLHWLQNYDLSNFDVRSVPQTTALKEQKDLSFTPEQDWWFHKLYDGALLTGKSGWPAEVLCEVIQNDYLDHMRRWQNFSRKASQVALGRFLTKHVGKLWRVQKPAHVPAIGADGREYTRSDPRAWHYRLPTLNECRAKWDELHGKQEWPDLQLDLAPVRERAPF